jgi:hypothetical protein
MTPKLESAEYAGGHLIRLRFADGRAAEVDLSGDLRGEVFAPLEDPAVFQRFRLDRELNTICWETGADLAPEYLYDRAGTQLANDGPAARR